MSPRVVSFANQKGGVGKTATVLGLASAIAHAGGRALVIDMDPQGNATTGMGFSESLDEVERTMFDVMSVTEKGSIDGAIYPSSWTGVDIAPANLDLANIEKSGEEEIPWRLFLATENSRRLPVYDAVLIDCPPSLGRLMFAALLASDGVVAVTEPSIDSVRGMINLRETVSKVQLAPGSQLVEDKIVISKRENKGEHIDREAQLRKQFGDLVARTVIPDLGARMDAHSTHTAMHKYRGGKAIALQVAYTDLMHELGIKIAQKEAV